MPALIVADLDSWVDFDATPTDAKNTRLPTSLKFRKLYLLE